jgi:hypothetical protein
MQAVWRELFLRLYRAVADEDFDLATAIAELRWAGGLDFARLENNAAHVLSGATENPASLSETELADLGWVCNEILAYYVAAAESGECSRRSLGTAIYLSLLASEVERLQPCLLGDWMFRKSFMVAHRWYRYVEESDLLAYFALLADRFRELPEDVSGRG